jgi:glycosyltransferase involved in cell wall biosynthesis
MKTQPLVSILINNYNYGRFLRAAIDSALDQTYPVIEVIVVDDGSTDGSDDIIKSYGNKITPILKRNGGQASAFNTGFAASQGEIICLLDSDDLFKPDKVAEIVQIFQDNENIGWCFHPLEILDQDSRKIAQADYQGASGTYDIRPYICQGKLSGKLPFSHIATSGLCFHRSLLQQVLPMPEEIRITSDDYLKYTAFGISPGFVILNQLAKQTIHGNNAYTFKPDNEKLRAKIQILTAYWMKKNFSGLSKFSDRIFALGLSIYRLNGGVEPECQAVIKNYLASATIPARWEIYARTFAKEFLYRVLP